MLQEVVGDPLFVRVLDFGLAKFVAESSETSVLMGTPVYMAPEQLLGKNIGPWTDVYSVGTLILEMLTGTQMFFGQTSREVMARKLDPDFDIRAMIESLQVPDFLHACLCKMLEHDCATRYQTAAGLLAELSNVLDRVDDSLTIRLSREAIQESRLSPGTERLVTPAQIMHEPFGSAETLVPPTGEGEEGKEKAGPTKEERPPKRPKMAAGSSPEAAGPAAKERSPTGKEPSPPPVENARSRACPHCLMENDPDAVFCVHCSRRLDRPVTAEREAPPIGTTSAMLAAATRRPRLAIGLVLFALMGGLGFLGAHLAGVFGGTETEVGDAADVAGPLESPPVERCVIQSFAYVDGASKSLPNGSIEYVLQQKLQMALDGVTVIIRPGRADEGAGASAPSSGPTAVITGSVAAGKDGAEFILELSGRLGEQEDTLSVAFSRSSLLSGDGPHASAPDQVFRWLIGIGEGWHLSPHAGREPAYTLTATWDAFEYFMKGETAWNMLNVDDAKLSLVEAVRQDPRFLLAAARLAEVREFSGFSEPARKLLATVREALDNDPVAADRTLGPIDLRQFRALEARLVNYDFRLEQQLRRELVDTLPHLPQVHYDLAESYFHAGQCEKAIPEYGRALLLKENFLKAYNHRAYCYAYRGDFESALQDLQQYLVIATESGEKQNLANAYDSFGDIHAQKGDYEIALKYKAKACESSNQEVFVLSKAKVLLLMGRDSEARELFESFIRAGKDGRNTAKRETKVKSLVHLAYLDLAVGRDSAARGRAMEAVALIPEGDDKASEGPQAGVRLPLDGDLPPVRRSAFHKEIWVQPLWLLGVLEYRAGHYEKLRDICNFLYRNVIRHYRLSAEAYLPAYKYYRFLAFLRNDLRTRRWSGVAKEIERLERITDKMGYWTTMFDRSYALVEYAKVALERKWKSGQAAEELLQQALVRNPHCVPALVLMCHLRLELGDRPGAESALREAHRSYRAWGGDDDGYLGRQLKEADALLEGGG